MILRDLSWVSQRTNFWDAIGLAAYGLLFALVESTLVFLILLLLSILIPRRWDEEKRISLAFILFYVTAIWAIIGQLFFLVGIPAPEWLIHFLINTAHPGRYLYAITILLILPTILIPVYIVARSQKAVRLLRTVMDKLELITTIYLGLDFFGLVIVLLRNL
jgi:hypothetical protein